MNSFQILLLFYKIEWILNKIQEFEKNSFKNEKNCKNSFNFKEKWTNIVYIECSSQNSIIEKKKH